MRRWPKTCPSSLASSATRFVSQSEVRRSCLLQNFGSRRASPPMRIMCALPNRKAWDSKSATSSPCPSARSIIMRIRQWETSGSVAGPEARSADGRQEALGGTSAAGTETLTSAPNRKVRKVWAEHVSLNHAHCNDLRRTSATQPTESRYPIGR